MIDIIDFLKAAKYVELLLDDEDKLSSDETQEPIEETKDE